ncbi:Fungal trans [Geosmithia morbida]|uniref:Fungal trans n=1 Tax=Geosmithia morbida TaxID=1094350 RepID=A0A9P4YN61_9HYPO|nr:Fungal trans [Geosmithia morbida]KAF4119532.1 Fungal trans [Geosmithia morbida]
MATTLLNSNNSKPAQPSAPANSAAQTSAQPPKPIRFVNSQGRPPSKRRRINAACLTCRRRKTRCAGERPRCSTCVNNNHQCLGYQEDKKDGNDAADARFDADDDDDDDAQETNDPSVPHRQSLSHGNQKRPNLPAASRDRSVDDDSNDRLTKKSRIAAADPTPPVGANASSRSTAADHQRTPLSQHRQLPGPAALRSGAPSASAAKTGKGRPPRRDATSPAAHQPSTTSPSSRLARARTAFDAPRPHLEDPASPMLRRATPPGGGGGGASNHRVPYFRYFGPTAIVPGFKQMVVSVRHRRRSTNGSLSDTSPLSNPSGTGPGASTGAESDLAPDEPPAYDVSDPAPVHPLIISLVTAFFVHLGCNYPFLRQDRFVAMVKEKRAEPILVDAVCSLAARFSDSPVLTAGRDGMPRTLRGQVFAQRAKQATVDTFLCPTVGAVQACLLMAYEGFGANQDSALWMYLGLAIRMAVDLGLQKRVGIQYRGDERDPRVTKQQLRRARSASESPGDARDQPDTPLQQEERDLEQERVDTFWAVFVLDRLVSSGTGRPVTLRDDDFELPFPKPGIHPDTHWPTPFPMLVEIVHMYGRVSDMLNNIHDISDLTQETWHKLMTMESHLTMVYKNWDVRLQFTVPNFKAYLRMGQGTTFILLHFWFHALFIILHQPTLLSPFGELRSELQLLPDSRELSMSSAKTICDILAFADLIDPDSFIGNPFTSQPMYIAACAFLMESSATVSQRPSREASPSPREVRRTETFGSREAGNGRTGAGGGGGGGGGAGGDSKKLRHSLLASAANQNYQQCYSSLQNLQAYWGGVKYILTALDQKSKGIWDCETYTLEEYESAKTGGRGGLGSQFQFDNSAMTSPNATVNGPPIGWTLAGTANSPSSSLTLMYQNMSSGVATGAAGNHRSDEMLTSPQQPRSSRTPPPPRQQTDDVARHMTRQFGAGGMYPPPFPQATTSAIRSSPRPPMPPTTGGGSGMFVTAAAASGEPSTAASFSPPGGTSGGRSAAFDGGGYTASPTSTMADAGGGGGGGGGGRSSSNRVDGDGSGGAGGSMAGYHPTSWGPTTHNMDSITFDSQDIDIGALGLQQPELMGPWLDYISSDMLGLFNHQDASQGDDRRGT